MASDVDDIITIKQLLNNSLKDEHNVYIKQVIDKNVKDCNLLYTQVCYLIKLFVLHDYENNEGKYNDYKFNEIMIRKCFKLIKTSEIIIDIDNDDDKNNKNSLIDRLNKFYQEYNLNENNKVKFVKPENVSSITHITDSLSRDIQTNITNNIILNYTKYLKEYVNLNLKLIHKEIEDKQINIIYNDLINNTLLSDIKYHDWINKNKILILPNFEKKIQILNFKDGLDNYKKIFIKHIKSYVEKNQKLLNLISVNGDNKNNTIKLIISKLINENENESNYNNWINENLNLIINDFNLCNKINLNKELEKNPYQFIKHMIYINKNLELNGSKKKYQIIPLRTNLTPKFIHIGIDALVDILDSKYLLNNIKNYYHANNKKGLILFETYFKFDSKFIKKIIKKGYVFSGSIYTNGYEINYIFNSKSYDDKKNNFHSKGKEEIKLIKDNTKGLNEEQKKEYEKKRLEEKEQIKKENKKIYQEKIKKIKKDDKDKNDKILKTLENEIIKLNTKYQLDLKKIEEEHYNNLKLEFDMIDKKNVNGKKILNEIMEKLNIELVNKNVFLKHVYDRDYLTLLNDYDNIIDEKYKEIKKKDINNENNINEIKNKISKLRNELNVLKKEKFSSVNDQYKEETQEINSNINKHKNNKIMLKRLIEKMNKKVDLLNYETKDDISLTKNHIELIVKSIIKILLRIKEMNICNSLNKYLNELGDINQYLLNSSNEIIKEIVTISLKYLSIDMSIMNLYSSNNVLKLMNIMFEKVEKKESLKNDKWNIKHNEITKKLNEYSNELNKLMNKKNEIEKELWTLFLNKNKEIMKVDEMSKKVLSILDQMNWVVIDPGINSILTMMSKDGKTKMSYSKCEYLNITQRKKTQNKIEKIKKEKIIKLENKLTKDKTRLRTSNDYKKFNEYFILKMEMHMEVCKLYEDKRLNKLKWYSFINEKRSETHLINKIKNKFNNPLKKTVLILGDWSMKKNGIKSISTPNKKYERLLKKHFLVLGLNEFRSSILENESELKCENMIKKMDYKKMSIKEIHALEKIKKEKPEKYKKIMKDKKIHKILTCKTSIEFVKYINRDLNAVKNMKKIVLSYIEKNKKPLLFIEGTKICNSQQAKE